MFAIVIDLKNILTNISTTESFVLLFRYFTKKLNKFAFSFIWLLCGYAQYVIKCTVY